MTGRHRARRSQARATRGGTFAAATVLAGAGLFGVAAVGPEVAGAQAAQVQVALTGSPTFAQSLQTLLDDWDVGTLNQLLGLIGIDFDTPVSSLLADLNPNGLTLEGIANTLGFSLSVPLYSSTGTSLLGSELLFQAPASFYSPWDGAAPYANIDGTPLGNVGLGKLVDLLLGGAGEGDHHSVADLANQLNFSLSQHLPAGLVPSFAWLVGLPSNPTYGDVVNFLGAKLSDFNDIWRGQGAAGNYGPWVHDVLNSDSSLNDWLSGLLGMPTTDVTKSTYSVVSTFLVDPSNYVFTGSSRPLGVGSDADASQLSAKTLGDYLQTVAWGTGSGHLSDVTLGNLLNLPAGETWDAYLSNMLFGGNLFHPGGDSWGAQSLGELVTSFLPSVTGGDMAVTDFLEALGLLNW